MSETFDSNSIFDLTTTCRRFTCAKHGDQGSIAGIEIKLTVAHGSPAAHLNGIHRIYCMECWIGWMDANLEQLSVSEVPVAADHSSFTGIVAR